MDRLSAYDYDLPSELIAQTPLEDRSSSRLLVVSRQTGRIEHRRFTDIASILSPGDLLVMNDTRVTALRLKGRKSTGGDVEALLLRRSGTDTYEALMRPGRRLRKGVLVSFGDLRASVTQELSDGRRELRFESVPHLHSRILEIGSIPLPPYITAALPDPERYQTVFARTGGSSAAPTAGLHFTEELLDSLRSMGVQTATVTLDVGIDTFRPVQNENLDEHRMHGERCEVPEETAARIARCKGRVIAVGTTTVRTLETNSVERRQVRVGTVISDLFIRPGFTFRTVDGMFTNFHLPKTSMLIMIASFIGRDLLMSAYQEAIQQNYRFLSFGDSMLLL